MEMDQQLEQQINITFLVKLGKNGPEIHQMLQQVCGEDALKERSGSSVFGKTVKTPRTMQGQDGTFRDLLHAANLRHGTHGFTSLPKEGVLRIFSPLKIRRLRPGLNP